MTKYYFAFIATILLLVVGCDASDKKITANEPSGAANALTIEIEGSAMTINSHEFQFPMLLAELVEVLGPADRVSELENRLSTWDSLGLVAYESKAGEPLISISIQLVSREFDFSAKSSFDGTLLLNGVRLTKSSKANALLDAGLTPDDSLTFIYAGEFDDVKIIADFFENEIESVSINE